METPSTPQPRQRWLSRSEADRLLQGAITPHIRLFLILALHTAARATAILQLRWSAVDFEASLIGYGHVEGDKRRTVVPMTEQLRRELRAARAGATCDSVIEYGGKPATSVKTGVRAAARRAGLTDVSPHVLRHTAACWLAMGGHSMQEIAEFLGHGDARMTRRVYVKLTPSYLRAAVETIDGVNGATGPGNP